MAYQKHQEIVNNIGDVNKNQRLKKLCIIRSTFKYLKMLENLVNTVTRIRQLQLCEKENTVRQAEFSP